ncbi:hypothetical protein DV702_02085 [Sporosarcina sp. PTS2304]|uniref:hypothetical protein n=1 Tax=Sporosarcina sp. PTS2304 TaxID=2283194 RepID=UPI000E0D2D54|nr:hypothetical protein [Sporosarcina sp. PTS2304]AXH98607.1 hypothetical protein DV702_02085 [Sporosarcina sp. PTS2304]
MSDATHIYYPPHLAMVNVTIIWALIILFIIQPDIAHEGAVAGAQLFLHALLPYLLPYIILTQWLLKMPSNRLQKNRWAKYIKAYVLGSFGGFPVGAVTVSEMKKSGELSSRESSLLLAACHAPGPMFIIGFVGNELFGSVADGWKLLLAIHVANIAFFLLSLIFLQSTPQSSLPQTVSHNPKTSPLLSSIKDSSSVILLVATTVIFFSSLGNVLSHVVSAIFPVDMDITKTLLLAIFEMTSGVQAATEHFSGTIIYPILIAAILSINGLSIHMQVMTLAKGAGISLLPYIVGRAWNIALVPLLFFWIY